MKVNLPENHSDITLAQYLDYQALKKREDLTNREFDKRKVMIFVDIDYRDVEKIEITDYKELTKLIDTAIETDAEFVKRFTLDGVEYGFTPNLDEMQAKEFFDLKMYGEEDENLHKLMAILFRPVTGEDAFGNYAIEPYRGTHHTAEKMREMPMSIVFGAIFFFRNLRTQLADHTLSSSGLEQLQKAEERKLSSRNGGGIRRFMTWLRGNRGNSNTSKT